MITPEYDDLDDHDDEFDADHGRHGEEEDDASGHGSGADGGHGRRAPQGEVVSQPVASKSSTLRQVSVPDPIPRERSVPAPPLKRSS